jgi:hypothetical protein
MADRKIRFMVISKFEQKCKQHGRQRPVINKNREQWAADALLESYRLDVLETAMDYYLKVNDRPTWSWFAGNVDKLLMAIEIKKQDDEFRAKMREKAKLWLT